MKKIIICILMILISFSVFSQNTTNKLDVFKHEMREYIEKKIKDRKIVGISLALVDNQETIWSEGFGYSDKENEVKASPNTIYLMCSISKLFTASSVMQLAEKGKIDIDDSIQSYIPELKFKSRFGNPHLVTPRNILNHHSGLPTDIDYLWASKTPPPFETVVHLLDKEYLCQKPNTIFSYSNTGYSLLGVLIERESKQSFSDYTKNNLFKPLNMNSTSFGINSVPLNLLSKNYIKKKAAFMPFIRDVPAGMMYSNVSDVANFIKMTFNEGSFNGNQILKSQTLSEMQTVQNKDYKLDIDFEIGLGWWLKSNVWGYGGRYAEHGGDYSGFHGQLATLIDHKIGVIVLTNTDKGAMSVRLIAEKILKEYLALKKGLSKPEKEQNNNELRINETVNLDSVAGDYIVQTQGLIKFNSKKDKLTAKTGLGKLVIKQDSVGKFNTSVKLLGFIPINVKLELMFRNINNTNYLLFSNQMYDASIVGLKTSKSEITDVWKKRFGKYKNINEDLTYSIVKTCKLYLKDDYLFLETHDYTGGKDKVVLKIINNNQAIIDGIGRGTGNTIYFDNNEIYWGGIKLKKVN